MSGLQAALGCSREAAARPPWPHQRAGTLTTPAAALRLQAAEAAAQGRRQRQAMPAARLQRQRQCGSGGPVRCSAAAAEAGAGPSDIFVLDFDGVLCDSEKEVSHSAFEACKQLWPSLFGGLSDAERVRVLTGTRAMRPRLVKGWEAMVHARLALEDDSNVARVLADWDGLLPSTLEAWRESPDAIAAAFEAHRASHMAGNAAGWRALNPLYPGVAEALAACPSPTYFASSKATSRLVSLLTAPPLELDIDADSPRLFASLIPPNERKIEALRTVMGRPLAAGGAALHFVDDRFETLQAVVEQAPDVAARYNLYLASWGYCTDEELAAAARLPGVRVLALPQFCELLRWGVVMGVDDGCEPTAEEAEASVRS